MFVSEKEAEERISSLDNLINRLQHKKIHNGGRPKGRKNDTVEKQLEVAEDAIVLGPTKAAEKHDTTISRASLLSDGIVTHSKGSDEELAPKVKSKKEEVHEKALDILTASMLGLESRIGSITKPRDLSAIAVDMAKIAERTNTKFAEDDNNKRPSVQVIVYAPRIKDADEYEVIDI